MVQYILNILFKSKVIFIYYTPIQKLVFFFFFFKKLKKKLY